MIQPLVKVDYKIKVKKKRAHVENNSEKNVNM